MRVLPLACALALLLLLPNTATAPVAPITFHVDANLGDDANDGLTAATPFRTLGRLGSASVNPGDSILLARESTWSEVLQLDRSGTEIDLITVDAYGVGSAPRITGVPACVVVTGDWVLVRTLEASGCSWAGFSVRGDNVTLDQVTATGNVVGVHVTATASDARILRSTLRDNNLMSQNTPTPTDDDSGAMGILLQGERSEVAYNTISGSDAFSYDYGRDGSAVEVYGAQRSFIHHNLARDNQAFTELGSPGTADNTYSFNVVLASLDTADGLITRGASSPWGPVYRTRLERNTIFLSGASSQGFVCYGGCATDILEMRGNIVQAVLKVGYADGAYAGGHNLFWGGPRQFPLAVTDIEGDPRFVDAVGGDLRLAADSPAVDSGDPSGSPGLDFGGDVVPADGDDDGQMVPDMGAYERPASAPLPPRDAQATLDATSQNVTIAWVVMTPETGLDHYGVFRSASYDPAGSGYVQVSPDLPPGTAQWTDVGAATGPGAFFYLVRGVNATGATRDSPGQVARFTATLAAGRHLVAVPVIAPGDAAGRLAGNLSWSSVAAFDASDALDPWKRLDALRGGDLTADLLTRGLWVTATTGGELRVAGRVPCRADIQLRTGWNLVGFPGMMERTVAAAILGLVGPLSIEGMSPEAPYHIRSMAATEVLRPMEGYWVHSPTDQIWTVVNDPRPGCTDSGPEPTAAPMPRAAREGLSWTEAQRPRPAATEPMR